MKIGRITYFIPFYNIEVLLWCMYSGGLNNGNIYPWLLQYMPLNGPNHSNFKFSITKLFNVFWYHFKCPRDRSSVFWLTCLLLHKFIILLDKVSSYFNCSLLLVLTARWTFWSALASWGGHEWMTAWDLGFRGE